MRVIVKKRNLRIHIEGLRTRTLNIQVNSRNALKSLTVLRTIGFATVTVQ